MENVWMLVVMVLCVFVRVVILENIVIYMLVRSYLIYLCGYLEKIFIIDCLMKYYVYWLGNYGQFIFIFYWYIVVWEIFLVGKFVFLIDDVC